MPNLRVDVHKMQVEISNLLKKSLVAHGYEIFIRNNIYGTSSDRYI